MVEGSECENLTSLVAQLTGREHSDYNTLTERFDKDEIGEIVNDSIYEIIRKEAHKENGDDGDEDDLKEENIVHTEGLTALEVALSCVEK
jgi:hypothetical protein